MNTLKDSLLSSNITRTLNNLFLAENVLQFSNLTQLNPFMPVAPREGQNILVIIMPKAPLEKYFKERCLTEVPGMLCKLMNCFHKYHRSTRIYSRESSNMNRLKAPSM